MDERLGEERRLELLDKARKSLFGLGAFAKDLCRTGNAQEVKGSVYETTGYVEKPKIAPLKGKQVVNIAEANPGVTEDEAIAMFEAVPEEDKDTTKACAFRSSARNIFIGKVKVPTLYFEKLTNAELRNFLETLREMKDPPAVKDAIALTVEDRLNAKPKAKPQVAAAPNQPNPGVIDINEYDE